MVAVRRQIFPVPVDAPLTTRQLYGRACRVHGVALKETSGAAGAQVTFHNGSNINEPSALPYALSAGGSTRDWFGDSGIWFDGGVFFEVVSGLVTGCVFISELASDVFAETDLGQLVKGEY